MTKKICTKCKQEKNIVEFSEYKEKNKLKRRARCNFCRNEDQKERYRKNPDVHRAYLYKQKYGLSLEEYDQMVENQGGMCKICGTTKPNGHHGRFVVDHNHKSNKIRGLLCSTCNTGLGNFFDNPETLIKAAQYLYTNGYYGKTTKSD